MPASLLQPAVEEDVADLVALHLAVNRDLTERYGIGPWSGAVTEKGVRWSMRRGSVYVARRRRKLVATLTLTTRKPWAIDKRYFAAAKKPLYLIGMAVLPSHQRKGIGRLCIEEALSIAQAWQADAIRLDAFDADAGAGRFYLKCGFQEAGRAVYRGAPLIYFDSNTP